MHLRAGFQGRLPGLMPCLLPQARYWLTQLAQEMQERLSEDTIDNRRHASLITLHLCFPGGNKSKASPMKRHDATAIVRSAAAHLQHWMDHAPRGWSLTAISLSASSFHGAAARSGSIKQMFERQVSVSMPAPHQKAAKDQPPHGATPCTTLCTTPCTLMAPAHVRTSYGSAVPRETPDAALSAHPASALDGCGSCAYRASGWSPQRLGAAAESWKWPVVADAPCLPRPHAASAGTHGQASDGVAPMPAPLPTGAATTVASEGTAHLPLCHPALPSAGRRATRAAAGVSRMEAREKCPADAGSNACSAPGKPVSRAAETEDVATSRSTAGIDGQHPSERAAATRAGGADSSGASPKGRGHTAPCGHEAPVATGLALRSISGEGRAAAGRVLCRGSAGPGGRLAQRAACDDVLAFCDATWGHAAGALQGCTAAVATAAGCADFLSRGNECEIDDGTQDKRPRLEGQRGGKRPFAASTHQDDAHTCEVDALVLAQLPSEIRSEVYLHARRPAATQDVSVAGSTAHTAHRVRKQSAQLGLASFFGRG
jgi:hypothetical protein